MFFGQVLLVQVALFIAFDSFVFILTCVKTLHFVIQTKKFKILRGIAYILLRDGKCRYYQKRNTPFKFLM